MRTTININDTVYAALKHRAFDSGVSISAMMEEAVKYQLLEDAEDIEDADIRVGESTPSFQELTLNLRSEGLI